VQSMNATQPAGSGRGERAFRVAPDGLAEVATQEFSSGPAECTLQFLDRVLLRCCCRMVEFGAYAGFSALYAASLGTDVFAFEPSPASHELLARNVSENPELAPRIRLFRHGISDVECYAPLYAKGPADADASIFREVERQGVVCGLPDAIVPLRDAAAVLREVGIDERTLVKIDIAGAEYRVLPGLAGLLAERKPWLHVSFHPFNLVAGADPYRTALLRLRSTMQAAEALACYRFIHVHDPEDGWCTIGSSDRMDFLRHYLLRAKPIPHITSPQYGFVHALAFSDQALPPDA